MKCRACKMDIPNGAIICPHCRTKQGGLGCAVVVLFILIAVFFIVPLINSDKSSSNKATSNSTAAGTNSTTISKHDRQNLINSLRVATKSIFDTDVKVYYIDGLNYYSIRVWDEKLPEISKSDNPEEWEKAIDKAVSLEIELNQKVKKVDSTSYATFSYSTSAEHDDSLLLISDGEIFYDVRTAEPSETTASEETPATTTYPKINGFLIGDREGTTYDGYCEVVGVVANATGYNCNYVQITIGFYNENDVKIDSGIDNILNLNAGETWQYEVTGFGDGITNFKIDDITWY